MVENESLTEIANKAGFFNLHSRPIQLMGLMGSIMSDKFEVLYVKGVSKEEIDVFGIQDQHNFETCAIYRLNFETLYHWLGGAGECNPGRGGVNIDKEKPLYEGQQALDILKTYIK